MYVILPSVLVPSVIAITYAGQRMRSERVAHALIKEWKSQFCVEILHFTGPR